MTCHTGWELSHPSLAKKADTQPLRPLLQKAQTKAWLLLRPAPGAQPGAQGSQGLHLPAPHPLACLSVLLAWPKGASDSRGPGLGVGCGCVQWAAQTGDRTSYPEQQMKGLFLVRSLLFPVLLASPPPPMGILRLRGD